MAEHAPPGSAARGIEARSADALHAAACLAVDPVGLGGAVLRTDLGEASERWLELLARLLPPAEALRRLPLHIDDERLLGGTDLAATLRSGRAVRARGLLEEWPSALFVVPSAERAPPELVARLGAALDRRAVSVAREGMQHEFVTRCALVALDGGRSADERCAPGLRERLALHIDLGGLTLAAAAPLPDAAAVRAARGRLGAVQADAEALRALCVAALACGIDSLRAPLLALRVACVHAALAARSAPCSDDLQFAARLVLGPRATVDPAAAEPPAPPDPSEPEPSAEAPRDATPPGDGAAEDQSPSGTLEEQVQEAAQAAIPAGLLAQLAAAQASRHAAAGGRAGALAAARRRGRPAGVRAGRPRNGTRLNIVATLRTAAPWQRLRRSQAGADAPRVQVRASDFRVTWFRQRAQTVTIFALDASGSSALHRLAEAKGAVELLLADCYVRRDQVAVVAFRGRGAELLLAPTRSLVRARRSLAGLPGGGGTPLAAGVEAACRLAAQARRQGLTPTLVLLTDGHANVGRDGSGGRAHGERDALQAARQARAMGLRALLIDTAPRPQPLARVLAETMQARYVPLPHADARAMAAAVRHAG